MKSSEHLLFPTTELCVDLKILSRKRRRMGVGEVKAGVLVHDNDEHFRFVENAYTKRAKKSRHRCLFHGSLVNLLQNERGQQKTTFRQQPFEAPEQQRRKALLTAQEILLANDYDIDVIALAEEKGGLSF